MTPNPIFLAQLVRSVAVLALPFDAQVEWLSSVGLGDPEYADELATELNDGYLLANSFTQAGWISPEFEALVGKVDGVLAEHSGSNHDDFWSMDGLRNSAEWTRVRTLARAALAKL